MKIEGKDGSVIDVLAFGENVLHVALLTAGLIGGVLFAIPSVVTALCIYGAQFFNRRGSKEESIELHDLADTSPIESLMLGFTIVSAFLGGDTEGDDASGIPYDQGSRVPLKPEGGSDASDPEEPSTSTEES